MPDLVNNGCPFCLENGKIDDDKIVKKALGAYLVREYSQNVPGTLQIVPFNHKMGIVGQLLYAWSSFWLLRHARLLIGADCNLSVNFGKDAGQTLPHSHIWVIPRSGYFAGKGLAYYVALNARCKRELRIDLETLFGKALKKHTK